jgi:hypothetical protein
MAVIALIGKRLKRKDRLHLSFAIQKGISAMILAIFFESYIPGIVAVIAPAIVILNFFYFMFNKLINNELQERKLDQL